MSLCLNTCRFSQAFSGIRDGAPPFTKVCPDTDAGEVCFPVSRPDDKSTLYGYPDPVPAACRSSGRGRPVGQTTGGGPCVAPPCTNAAGSLFQISGNEQISIIRNGSLYNTDAGIGPDSRLDKPGSIYDRPAPAAYLHDLKQHRRWQ